MASVGSLSHEGSTWSMNVTLVGTSPSRHTKHINVGSVSWVNGVSDLHPISFLSIDASCWYPHIGNTRFNMKELEFLTSQETTSLLISHCFRFCPSDWMIYFDRDISFFGIEELGWPPNVLIVGATPIWNTKPINVGLVSWVGCVSYLHPISFLSILASCWHPHIGDTLTCF